MRTMKALVLAATLLRTWAFEPSISSPYEPILKKPLSMQEAQRRAEKFQVCNRVCDETTANGGRGPTFFDKEWPKRPKSKGNEPPSFHTEVFGNHHRYDESTASGGNSIFDKERRKETFRKLNRKRNNKGNEPPEFNTAAYANAGSASSSSSSTSSKSSTYSSSRARRTTTTSSAKSPFSSNAQPPPFSSDTKPPPEQPPVTPPLQKTSDGPTLYDILGASPDDSRQTLKQNYARKAKETHPDATQSDTAEAFHQVAEAYAILSDPLERQKYDQRLSGCHLKVEVVNDDEYSVHVNDFRVHVDNMSSASWVNEASQVYGGTSSSCDEQVSSSRRQPPSDFFGRNVPRGEYVPPAHTDVNVHRDFANEKGYQQWLAKQQAASRRPSRKRSGVTVNDGRWFKYRTV